MNLLYTLTAYPPYLGGAQLHQHLLAQHLSADRNLQVISFWNHNRTDWLLGTTLKAHGSPHDYTIDGIPVHRMGFNWYEKLRMAAWLPLYYPLMSVALPRVAQVIESHLAPYAQSAQLIHNVRIGREGLTYASCQVARQHHIPFILTPVHHPRWVGWRYREYIQLYQAADAIIALTPSEKQTLIGLGVAPDRIHITGIGPILAAKAHPERFRQHHNLDGPVVLFLGQHYSYKGFRHLLEAAPLVWRHCPEAKFVFAGPPVQNSEQVFNAFPDRRILRLGTVDLQTKTDALAACDILCVPSVQESFGGVYTEAWSFAKPVIGCDIPAVADVITKGVDGYLVEQQPESIADDLIDLLKNPATAKSMGAAGKAKVEARYTWPKLAAATLSAYEKVLHR
ncbi:glycosyltransferase family 1 protein [filamentous cyanobacterium CCP5]|nr:glycosyltransferase family 1 protein [filamentous cyanobacterium CCP5]